MSSKDRPRGRSAPQSPHRVRDGAARGWSGVASRFRATSRCAAMTVALLPGMRARGHQHRSRRRSRARIAATSAVSAAGAGASNFRLPQTTTCAAPSDRRRSASAAVCARKSVGRLSTARASGENRAPGPERALRHARIHDRERDRTRAAAAESIVGHSSDSAKSAEVGPPMIQEAADRHRNDRSARTGGCAPRGRRGPATSAAVTVPVVSSSASPRAASRSISGRTAFVSPTLAAVHPDQRTGRPLRCPRSPIARRGGQPILLAARAPASRAAGLRSAHRCARPRRRARARPRRGRPPDHAARPAVSALRRMQSFGSLAEKLRLQHARIFAAPRHELVMRAAIRRCAPLP